MELLKQSTAATIKMGPFLDSTDGNTAEPGLTISQADIRLSKNGGAFAQTNNATGATHDENGYYGVPLDTTDTATLGRLRVAIHESGALAVWADFLIVPANVYDSLVSGTDYLQTDAIQISGDATAADNAELAFDGTGYGFTNCTIPTVTTLTGHTAQTGDNFARIGANGASLSAIPWNASWDAEVQSEVDDAIVANNLDHLCKTATAGADMTTEVADNTILSRVLANGDTSAFDPSTDGMQPLRDHIGDGTNLTEAGGDGDHLTEAGGTGDQLTAVPWNAAWDAEVQSEANDALVAFFTSSAQLVDDIWGEASSITTAYGSLLARTYEMVNNKMTVNESTGAVALRNIGDSSDIATGSVVSSSGTTTRAELSWV